MQSPSDTLVTLVVPPALESADAVAEKTDVVPETMLGAGTALTKVADPAEGFW